VVTEAEAEQVLRSELRARSNPDPLPEQVLVDSLTLGHRALRRRREGLVGAVAALALVAGLAAATVRGESDTPEPAPSPPTVTPSPTASEAPATVRAGTWANALPLGAPPDVPYLAGTDVILPDGTRVETGGTGAGVIGLTVPGLVLLVESETEHPFSFTSRYAVVTYASEVRDLPASTLTQDSAQEALVSPDGRYFTNGGGILDMTDLSVVGDVPDAATIMLAWTPAGILYGDYGKPGATYHLLRDDGSIVDLDRDPGSYPNGTDVGYHGCRVVRLSAAGVTPMSDCISGLRSVSPSGRWALTDDLRLVDVGTGESRYLAGAPVDPEPYAYDKVWWDGDDSLLVPVFAQLVRCDTATLTCERATAGDELQDGRFALP